MYGTELGSLSNQELLELTAALPQELAERGLDVPATLGSVAVVPEAVALPSLPDWEQSLDALSEEERREAIAAREVLSRKYDRPVIDFSLVTTARNGSQNAGEEIVLVLSASSGIELGDSPFRSSDPKRSWNSIDPAKADDRFVVTVHGRELDVRTGVTLEAIQKLAANGIGMYECIWETGRQDLADERFAPILRIGRTTASRDHCPRDADFERLTLRPAVVIRAAHTIYSGVA